MTAPIKIPPNPTELIGTVRTLQDAVEVFRLMKDRLGLTNEFIDDVGGLTKGHADKLLGRSEQKRLGYDTFALLSELFAIEFKVYVNIDAVKRMEKVWEGRARPLFPNGKPGRVSKKLIEMAKPHVLRDFSALGGTKRAASLPARLRAKMSRKGGKSRMRRVTKAERSAMMKKGWETRRKNRELLLLAAPEISPASAALEV
jgi:hypothetical protein